MFLINFWLVLVFLVAFLSLKQAKSEGELCATLENEFPSQSRDVRKRIRERNPSRSNFAWWCEIFTCYAKFKGHQMQGKFGELPGVHCLHDIHHFELGKSGVQRFKQCAIWRWNEEVMANWRQLRKAEEEFRIDISWCENFRIDIPWCENFRTDISQCENFRTEFLQCKIFRATFL